MGTSPAILMVRRCADEISRLYELSACSNIGAYSRHYITLSTRSRHSSVSSSGNQCAKCNKPHFGCEPSWRWGAFLHYVYRHKNALAPDTTPNISGTCETVEFTRPTLDGDLVTFDASGSMNNGNALFGDTNTYNGAFNHGIAGPVRAYLLVTNSDATGTQTNVGHNYDVSGEAIVMDIASGAAWGMKGINDNTRENYSMVNVANGGGVYSALPSNSQRSRRFTFFPPSEWTTRFFVTPIGANMHTANLSATVRLFSTGDNNKGIYDRQGTRHQFTPIDHAVTCTGAVDLQALMDSTTWSAIENVGGWGWFRVESGDAVVFKLEFVVSNPTYGGTNNSGFLLSSPARP